MKAWVFGGMLVLSAALAACSSSDTGDGAGGGSGGGSGEGGGGDGGSGQATTGTNTGSTGTNTPATTGTTTGGGTCGADVSQDPACNTCGTGACCAEIEACYLDETGACFDADGALDSSTPGGAALIECLTTNCEAECLGGSVGGVCDSGISYVGADGQTPDEELNTCLGDACCDEYNACTQNGADVQGCISCFEAGGTDPLCAPAVACADASGCFGFQVCDSILLLEDGDVAECLGTSCCDETNACFGEDEASFDACVACLEAGATDPLCSGLAACDAENACGLLTEG